MSPSARSGTKRVRETGERAPEIEVERHVDGKRELLRVGLIVPARGLDRERLLA